MTEKNRQARVPTEGQRESLKGKGSRKNYWVTGKDGVRRGPAPLDHDGVRTMQERGAKVQELKQGEFWTMEIKAER